MAEVPLPGTRAATEQGCRCVRRGWTWDNWQCVLHNEPIPTGPGLCEHGELRWECAECADRQASYAAYVEDMRGLRPPRTNDFGAEL